MTDVNSPAGEVVELEPQPTAAVRIQQPMGELDLAAAFDRYLPMVAERITAEGSGIRGPSYGRYHQFGPDVVDVEIGFPVATRPSGIAPLASVQSGEVGLSELPGGPAAKAVHFGTYDGLPATYDALHDWIHAQPGYDDGPGPWESYVDMPSDMTDPSKVRTEIIWPLVLA